MHLGDVELKQIGGYVKDNLRLWLSEVAPAALSPAVPPADPVSNTQLLERVVRVEEELKAQRELFLARFEAVDRRFEANDQRFADMNSRFEDMNSRFADMNTRFEDMNTRFEDMKDYLNRRFNVLTWMIGLLTTVVVAALGMAVL
jgi:chaperonin cofactor prefoldin